MSKLTETKRAYDLFAKLIDQEIRQRRGSPNDLERFRQSLDTSFYLLAWAQFEYLVREETNEIVSNQARTHTLDKHAWNYLKDNLKSMTVRQRLDIIFHGNHKTLETLKKRYDVRNDAAHDYKNLPSEARDVSEWIRELEELIDLI